jgi:CRP-like cAMP-binding protein
MDLMNFGLPSLAGRLSPEDLAHLRTLASRGRYGDGQLLHARGEGVLSLGLVVEGAVRLVRRRPDGRMITQSTWGPGHHFGYLPVTTSGGRSHDAIAVGPTVVDRLSPEAVEKLLAERPAVARALLDVTTRRLALLADLYDDMRLLPPIVRLAKLLLLALTGAPDGRVRCVQDELAQLLGLSGVTVGQLLKKLSGLGLISTGYGYVTILDPERLDIWAAAQEPL